MKTPDDFWVKRMNSKLKWHAMTVNAFVLYQLGLKQTSEWIMCFVLFIVVIRRHWEGANVINPSCPWAGSNPLEWGIRLLSSSRPRLPSTSANSAIVAPPASWRSYLLLPSNSSTHSFRPRRRWSLFNLIYIHTYLHQFEYTFALASRAASASAAIARWRLTGRRTSLTSTRSTVIPDNVHLKTFLK